MNAALIGAGLRGVTSLANEVMNIAVSQEIVRVTKPDVADSPCKYSYYLQGRS
jgi:hypothetical protein